MQNLQILYKFGPLCRFCMAYHRYLTAQNTARAALQTSLGSSKVHLMTFIFISFYWNNETYTGKEGNKMTSVSVVLRQNVERGRYLNGRMMSCCGKHCRQDAESATVCWFTKAIHHVHRQLAVTVNLITEWAVNTTFCLIAVHTTHSTYYAPLIASVTQLCHLGWPRVSSVLTAHQCIKGYFLPSRYSEK